MSSKGSNHTMAERITLGISILILIGIIGLAGWASAQTGDEPAAIDVQASMEDVREMESGFYVPITITNNGGLTAESLVVTGELLVDGAEPETAEVTIDFLAGGESEKADLVFSTHPDEGEFTLGPTSFLHP